MKRNLLTSLVVCAAAACPASAAVISAQYDFTGGSLTSTDLDPSSTAGPITTTKTYIGVSESNDNYYIRSTDGTNVVYSTTVSDAIAADRRFSFTFTPTTATTLTKLEFTMGGNSGGSRSFTANIQVRSSLDANATALGTGTYAVPASGGSTSDTPVAVSIDLTQVDGFANVTSPITFNFFGYFTSYSATPPGAASDPIRVDNIVLTTVPEPAAGGMAGIAALALLRRRRSA